MNIRCGSCSKLFRVSDDKITGAGVKFPCTRCGEYVKITREAFDQYSLSQSAVSDRDMFKPELIPAKVPLPPASVEGEINKSAVVSSSQDFDLSAPFDHDVLEEDQILSFFEPAPAAESERTSEPLQAPSLEPIKGGPASEPKPETMARPPEEPEPQPKPAGAPVQPNVDVKAAGEPGPLVRREARRNEPVHPSQIATEKSARETPPVYSRAGKMFTVLIVTLSIVGLAGYGVFTYLQSTPQKEIEKVREAPHEVVSNEGLNIKSASGVVETNGDLLITGAVENTMDKERRAWYIVADIYDAQGNVLTKIGLLNGRQIYKRKDYDILSKRGVNVQELKAKSLQEQGVVIPPKGSVTFEIRCLQPPVGIATFNATPQTFDPVNLFREIAEEIK